MAAISAHRSFLSDVLERQAERRALIDPTHAFPAAPQLSDSGPSRPRLPTAGTNSKLNVANYVMAEETVRNDYCEWYGASGEWGSNFVLGAGDEEISEEYPALKRLMTLKNEMVDNTSHQGLYLPLSNPTIPSATLPTAIAIHSAVANNRFDSILITPPEPLDWSYISSLPLRNISADPGFVFLWVGAASSDGLEKGRECFAKWGFRRAEDIVWVKTNKGGAPKSGNGRDEGGLFAGQKEHCLMGIRGTVRRSTDSRFVHCNVDTDVMVWEESGELSGPSYPPYLQTLVENFCLGTRRLHLFGNPSDARRGWVTAGSAPLESSDTSPEVFDPSLYPSQVFKSEDGRPTLPYHHEIDSLRPKSPQRKPRTLPNTSSYPSAPQRGGMANRPYNRNYGQQLSPYPQSAGLSPGISPGLGMGMGDWGMGSGMDMNAGMMGMDGQMPAFGHHPNQPLQAQFDPMVLAQAQAQAHAMIQAQMQMAMMHQMQAQMGMGMQEMYAPEAAGQNGAYGQFGAFGMPMMGGQEMGYVPGMEYGYAGEQQGGETDWPPQNQGNYGQGGQR